MTAPADRLARYLFSGAAAARLRAMTLRDLLRVTTPVMVAYTVLLVIHLRGGA